MGVTPGLRGPFGLELIADVEQAREDVTETVACAEFEPFGVAGGHPAQVDPGEAVGLLFGHDDGCRIVEDAAVVLDGVTVLVRQHADEGHLAEELRSTGNEDTAVPSDQIVFQAEERVDQPGGALAAHLGRVRIVGVVGHQGLDGFERFRQRAVVLFPELLDVVDRQGRDLVDLAAVGVLHLTRCVRRIGSKTAVAVGDREATNPVGIEQH